MARSHARVFTSIWDDEDFVALNGNAQRCYLMLLTQPNLGHAGILPTTIRRWTLLAAAETEESLRAAVDDLERARFVLMDERTEELLVRSLIRNDGVWKQPKVLAVAIGEAASIRSARLRACVAEELARIDPAELGEKTRPDVEALLDDLPHRLVNARAELGEQAPEHPPADPPPHPPADLGHDEGADGVRVGARAAPTPTPTPTTTPSIQLPAAADGPRQRGQHSVTQRAKQITDIYVAAQPLCRWPSVNGMVIKAIQAEQWTDEEIRDALMRLAADGRTVTAETLRIELQGFPPDRQGRAPRGQPLQSWQQESDDMFARAMERARVREAREEAAENDPYGDGGVHPLRASAFPASEN